MAKPELLQGVLKAAHTADTDLAAQMKKTNLACNRAQQAHLLAEATRQAQLSDFLNQVEELVNK